MHLIRLFCMLHRLSYGMPSLHHEEQPVGLLFQGTGHRAWKNFNYGYVTCA